MGSTSATDEHSYGFAGDDCVGRRIKGEVVWRPSEGKLILRTELGHSVAFSAGDLDQVEHVRAALAVGMQQLQEYRAANRGRS